MSSSSFVYVASHDIVRKAVQRHGGEMWCNSPASGDTTFFSGLGPD